MIFCSKGNKYKKLTILFLIGLLLLPFNGSAHASGAALEKLSRTDIFFVYLQLGFTHIIPLGFDHILFILSLFLLSPKLKNILWQATAFTVAHSITLGLAMYGVISSPPHIVEPIIALSIMFVALENIISDKLRPTRILIVFGFGLIHGLGFAGVLTELGLPEKEFVNALISFNLGVEIGQVCIIFGGMVFICQMVSPQALVPPAHCCAHFCGHCHHRLILDHRKSVFIVKISGK